MNNTKPLAVQVRSLLSQLGGATATQIAAALGEDQRKVARSLYYQENQKRVHIKAYTDPVLEGVTVIRQSERVYSNGPAPEGTRRPRPKNQSRDQRNARMRSWRREKGITREPYRDTIMADVLDVMRQDRGRHNNHDLADTLGITPAQAQKALRRLELKGHITLVELDHSRPSGPAVRHYRYGQLKNVGPIKKFKKTEAETRIENQRRCAVWARDRKLKQRLDAGEISTFVYDEMRTIARAELREVANQRLAMYFKGEAELREQGYLDDQGRWLKRAPEGLTS